MKIHVLVTIHQLFSAPLWFHLSATWVCISRNLASCIFTCVTSEESDRSRSPIDLDRQGLSKNQGASALNIGTLSYGSVVEGTGVTRLGSRENWALPSSDRTTGDNLHESLCLLYIQSLSGLGGPGKLPQGWRLKCAVKRGTSKCCHVTVMRFR